MSAHSNQTSLCVARLNDDRPHPNHHRTQKGAR